MFVMFQVIPSDATRDPAILPGPGLKLCSTIGQLQRSCWEFFAFRFSVLLSLSHYDHSDSDSDTPNWCDIFFIEHPQK